MTAQRMLISAALLMCAALPARAASRPVADSTVQPSVKIMPTPDGVGLVKLSDEEWKKLLKADAYSILRKKGTEFAFSGKYWKNHTKGVYRCAGCGLELYTSDTKFESGTGWPSFWQPIAANHVRVATDNTLGMERDEVQCARCGGHLGHVFNDGPAPTHLRYCMNSAAMQFVPAK
ncbi:MAG: peptide-methionine (R)-S-oxide reductase MsrB [Candidatus Eisenbacteria bacterium]|nr:peptide-methionine (R)-S-oxide reductase MsrB [Candidatus Eisenbacteria bacterium]